jgi:hypothetical protein
MANETSTGAPLTATVGERLDEKAHEGETPGVDRAQAAVEDLRGGGHDEREEVPRAARSARREHGRRGRLGWAIAAGVGAYVAAGMVGRIFRR